MTTGPDAANIVLTSPANNNSTFNDASFTITGLDENDGELEITNLNSEAGKITFFNDAPPGGPNQILLEIEFDFAVLSSTDFSATEQPFFFETASNIIFSGLLVDDFQPVGNEEFSFALNGMLVDGVVEFSGAFTAEAATVIPVPAALPLMFSGLIGGWLVARRKTVA